MCAVCVHPDGHIEYASTLIEVSPMQHLTKPNNNLAIWVVYAQFVYHIAMFSTKQRLVHAPITLVHLGGHASIRTYNRCGLFTYTTYLIISIVLSSAQVYICIHDVTFVVLLCVNILLDVLSIVSIKMIT